jgi:hypothetical protein
MKNVTQLYPLADYIRVQYNGNQSAFGRVYGVPREQVRQWLRAKKPVLVTSGGAIVSVLRTPL